MISVFNDKCIFYYSFLFGIALQEKKNRSGPDKKTESESRFESFKKADLNNAPTLQTYSPYFQPSNIKLY